jgi:hypothetical protein
MWVNEWQINEKYTNEKLIKWWVNEWYKYEYE